MVVLVIPWSIWSVIAWSHDWSPGHLQVSCTWHAKEAKILKHFCPFSLDFTSPSENHFLRAIELCQKCAVWLIYTSCTWLKKTKSRLCARMQRQMWQNKRYKGKTLWTLLFWVVSFWVEIQLGLRQYLVTLDFCNTIFLSFFFWGGGKF